MCIERFLFFREGIVCFLVIHQNFAIFFYRQFCCTVLNGWW
jgi:hypothetical protein